MITDLVAYLRDAICTAFGPKTSRKTDGEFMPISARREGSTPAAASFASTSRRTESCSPPPNEEDDRAQAQLWWRRSAS